MKAKYTLIFLSAWAALAPTAWGGQLLNADGSLSSDFLDMKPDLGQKMTPMKVAQSGDFLALLKDAKSPDEKDWTTAVGRLGDLGIYLHVSLEDRERLGDKNDVQAGADIDAETRCKDCVVNLEVGPISSGDPRFTVVRTLDDVYLIDTQAQPMRAWYLGNEKGREGITFTGVVKMDEDHFRFVDEDEGEQEGSPAYRTVEVHDVDFRSRRQILTRGFLPQGLDNDGIQGLVVPQEVATGVDWYWIFSFGKDGWVDESDANDGIYQTFIKQLLEAGFRKAESVLEKKEWKALIKVAKAGGRTAYPKKVNQPVAP